MPVPQAGPALRPEHSVALFFLRFWRDIRDPFSMLFAVAFLVEGMGRVAYGVAVNMSEDWPGIYLIRLLAFGLIIAALIGKNLAKNPRT